MHNVLARNLFFVKEQVGMFKAANNYDIYDPNSNELILECREEALGFFTKILRFTKYKSMTPFDVEVRTPKGERIIRVTRGTTFFVSEVEVFDGHDRLMGKFKQKLFSIGGKFEIFGANEDHICTLQGKWTSWEFKFVKGEMEFAKVSKKWAGIGKELFTTADNYMLSIDPKVPADNPIRLLIMAAVICIDMVLKER
jgi:uncharacterized protein YxjI